MGKDAPNTTTELRKALDDKNLDAISVASPNHWHSLIGDLGRPGGQALLRREAGQPRHLRRPRGPGGCEEVRRGDPARHAAASSQGRADMIKAIQSGKYGKLAVSHGFCCKPRNGIGHKPPESPPDWLDWNQWRGPAVIDQYHGNFVHYNWHWFWATGNGDLNNQGTHELDVAFWALEPGLTAPVRAMALGGRFRLERPGRDAQHHVRHRRVSQRAEGVLQRPQRQLRRLSARGEERLLLRRRRKDPRQHLHLAQRREAEVQGERAEITPGGSSAASSPPAAPASRRWPTATWKWPTTPACSAT
jgi:hypothetical protein